MFFKRSVPPAIQLELHTIRERARRVHSAVGTRDVKLADLFGLLNEDERPAYRATAEVQDTGPRRVRPDEV